MSLTLSAAILKTTKHTSLGGLRATVDNRRHAGDDAEYAVDTTRLDDSGLQELAAAAEKYGDGKAARAIEAIRLARSGDFAKAVPSFKAFAGILHEFLTSDIIDGWIYVVGQDGNYYPELVTDIHFKRSMWGAGWCSLLSDDLRRMYKARLLQRVAVGLSSGAWQPGFPKWVYSYRLSGIGIEALGELPGEDVA